MNPPLPDPFSNSYTLGFIRQWFPGLNLVDYYLDVTTVGSHSCTVVFKEPITNGSVVLLDDELFLGDKTKCLDLFRHLDNLLFISKDFDLVSLLRNNGHTVVYEPFFLAIDDAISMLYLEQIPFRDKFAGEYNFLCLNRRQSPNRLKLMRELAQQDLMTHGYVTYHAVGRRAAYQFQHEHLRQDDLTHYTADGAGLERHNHLINNVWCSSNVKNYLYISDKFTGHTMVASETEYANLVTEKSFIALFCKKMPMIFSPRPIITMLQNEGFDCFTDIIDQSYDNEATWDKKITRGIAANRELLASDMRHKKNEIDHRTQRNYEHLVTHWLDRRLDTLKHNISSWYNS